MGFYALNKANSRTVNKGPTKTDQSQARETDINVIVGRYGIGGTVPGPGQAPMTGDFTELPQDLRGFIEKGRELDKLRAQLPKELAGKSTEELLALTAEQLTTILTPPAPPPATEEKPK